MTDVDLRLDLPPVDDAFIRTAIRGLRAPEHHPAFWGELTRELDAAQPAPAATAPPVAPQVEPAAAPAARPQPRPKPVPVPAPVAEVVPVEPVRPRPCQVRVPEDAGAERPPRREPLRAPAHAAPAGAERVRAFGTGAPPKPELVVRHDPAVVPRSLRRRSNAILLGVAAIAAVVALVAGLALVRSRSDTGGSPSTEQPSQPAAATSEDPSATPG